MVLYLVARRAVNTRKLLVRITGINPEVSLDGFQQRKTETKSKPSKASRNCHHWDRFWCTRLSCRAVMLAFSQAGISPCANEMIRRAKIC